METAEGELQQSEGERAVEEREKGSIIDGRKLKEVCKQSRGERGSLSADCERVHSGTTHYHCRAEQEQHCRASQRTLRAVLLCSLPSPCASAMASRCSCFCLDMFTTPKVSFHHSNALKHKENKEIW